MKTRWHTKFTAGASILLGTCAALVASDFMDNGPGRLTDLAQDSDLIVVASCVTNRLVVPPMHDVQFIVRREIKGTLKSFVLNLNAKDSPSYNALTGRQPALVFLKTGPDGALDLTTPFSALRLDASEAALPAVLSRELEIRAMPDETKRNTALKQLILPLLANGGASYMEESLAEDLLDLGQSGHIVLSGPELAMIARVATNSAYDKVALPLALVLAGQDAPQTDAACLHVLMDTDAPSEDHSFRLAPVLAQRPLLREAYVQKIEQTRDSAQIGTMLTQFYKVDPETLDTIYERLWRTNASSRLEIEHALKLSPTPARLELLRRLKAEAARP